MKWTEHSSSDFDILAYFYKSHVDVTVVLFRRLNLKQLTGFRETWYSQHYIESHLRNFHFFRQQQYQQGDNENYLIGNNKIATWRMVLRFVR
jgi:hypothetical protein